VPKTNAPTKNNDTDEPAKPGGDLGKDAFLKLLVAQLKYQDPSNPMDNSEFLAQTAQFTTVEKLTDLATVEQNLLNAQLQLGASNLIGKTVTYADKDGKAQTGVVTSAKFFTGGPPTLHVGDTDIALASVTEISNAAQPATDANTQTAQPPTGDTPNAQNAPPPNGDTPNGQAAQQGTAPAAPATGQPTQQQQHQQQGQTQPPQPSGPSQPAQPAS
jgi:flagellar basal-body rod modification protein FlgD